LAEVLSKLARTDEALELLTHVKHPQYDAKLHHIKGNIFLEQGDNASAEQEFQRALAQEPESDEYRMSLAWSLFYQYKQEEILATFRAARTQSIRLLRSEAWFLQKLGRRTEEVTVRERIVALGGATAGDHVELGRAYEWCGMTHEARTTYERAMVLHPEAPEVLWKCAALVINQSGVDALPNSAEFLYRIGLEARRAGWLGIAKKLLQKVVGLDPHHQPSLRVLSDITQKQGLLGESRELAVRAIERFPVEPESYAQLGRISAETECLPELPWTSSRQYLELAKIVHLDEKIREESLRRAIALDARSEEAWKRLILCLRRQERKEESMMAAEQARALGVRTGW
jgi:tetratricopeptide (TPR) repeat protein